MKIDYLNINKDNIHKRPDKFITTINKKDFIFKVSWNPEDKAFFFDLADSESKPILLGRKLVYGENILANIVDERLPKLKIIPLDKTGKAEKEGITFANFMKSVKLYAIVGDD